MSWPFPFNYLPLFFFVKAFANDPPTTVFLLSVRAGAVGINLTQANNVFLLEPVRSRGFVLGEIGSRFPGKDGARICVISGNLCFPRASAEGNQTSKDESSPPRSPVCFGRLRYFRVPCATTEIIASPHFAISARVRFVSDGVDGNNGILAAQPCPGEAGDRAGAPPGADQTRHGEGLALKKYSTVVREQRLSSRPALKQC